MIRSANPREAMLRPIGEWYVVVVCAAASLISYYAYEYFFMSRSISIMCTSVFAFFSLLYFRDGLRLRAYQLNIRRLRHYEIDPADIPFTPDYVLLGKGFRWLPIHTQRLRDTFRDYNTSYVVDSPLFTAVRNFCVVHKNTNGFRALVLILNKNSPLNPFRPLPDIGGNPAIHGIELNERDFIWRRDERVGHTGVFGATRVGKTRMAELIISSDIRAGAKKIRDAKNNGNVVIVIDPKGDGELLRRCVVECMEAGRLDDFYMFHLGFPEKSCLYNPIADFQKITEIAGRSTNQLAGEGSSAAFKEFSWRFVNINAQAIDAIGEEASYEKLSHYISNTEEILEKYINTVMAEEDPDWIQTVHEIEAEVDPKAASMMGRNESVIALTNYAKSILKDKEDPIIRGLVGALEYNKTYYDRLLLAYFRF